MRSIIVLFMCFIIYGCSSSEFSYSPAYTYTENDLRNINDEDILKAYNAKPQIKLPVKLAWYNLGNDTLYKMLKSTDSNIKLNYDLPKSLIEGFSPYDDDFNPRYYWNQKTVNLKAVRLLAARANCDLLIVVSAKYNVSEELNNAAWMNVLIFPIFFSKYYDVNYRYKAEVYIFDVRNGYMYKHLEKIPAQINKTLGIRELKESSEVIHLNFQSESSQYLRTEIYNSINDPENRI